MKYQHNQKVTCEIDGTKITDARISINDDGQPYICQNEKKGSNANNKLGYKYSWRLEEDFTDGFFKNLRSTEKTFENPEVGDEYKDKDGDSRFVLGVCGRVIFLSNYNDKDHYPDGYTKEDLTKYDYTIVQDEPEEEIEEITIDEVCKRLGKKVKII